MKAISNYAADDGVVGKRSLKKKTRFGSEANKDRGEEEQKYPVMTW